MQNVAGKLSLISDSPPQPDAALQVQTALRSVCCLLVVACPDLTTLPVPFLVKHASDEDARSSVRMVRVQRSLI